MKEKIMLPNLSKATFDKWQEAVQVAGKHELEIEQRACSIVKRICQEFPVELDYIEDIRYPKHPYVTYDLVFKKSYCDMTVLLSDQLIDLANGFPHRWLFEDFEKELVSGKKAFEAREAEQKHAAQAKRAAKKAKENKLKQSAAAKLTDEERKALGL